ncbi:MAG: aromatic ring-hydroxylating dioxygenase subunit alpha [Actinomycetota bacterium]|nr:aromatic ring-hydroxylating dioxygenase subunit alpha [Actinomycetota bacterium]
MTAVDDVRLIEAGAPPARFARGWHCLGLASSFADGMPHAVHAFGGKLVVWQGADGELHALDAYCRHMGGDLTMGTVEGDVVACPFHGWRWGGDGKCAEIPYARRVPPRARTKAWPVMVRNGQLFVWNDPEGSAPPDNVTIPDIEGYASGEWTDWTWDSIPVEGSHCREIVDNMVDMAHFYYIHKGLPTYFKNVFEGHVCTQYYAGTSPEHAATGALIEVGRFEGQSTKSEATYWGPSYLLDKLWDTYGDTTIESVLITCHYPVTPTSFVLMYGMIVKKLPGLDDEANAKVARKMTRLIGQGFLEDVKIWQHKTRIENPLLCEEDGPVYQLRRWYEQFYVDVADIAPEMVDRFEFELDTTRAVEAWQRQLVAARQAAE